MKILITACYLEGLSEWLKVKREAGQTCLRLSHAAVCLCLSLLSLAYLVTLRHHNLYVGKLVVLNLRLKIWQILQISLCFAEKAS